mmetsp:Transcript_4382/g.15556  ORF Transcript_4382/g.15556 Transcript_4382/m.15556 type:complete len:81 (-) Transcript_4382:2295-2537(-)
MCQTEHCAYFKSAKRLTRTALCFSCTPALWMTKQEVLLQDKSCLFKTDILVFSLHCFEFVIACIVNHVPLEVCAPRTNER